MNNLAIFFPDEAQNRSVMVSLDGTESELEIVECNSLDEKVNDILLFLRESSISDKRDPHTLFHKTHLNYRSKYLYFNTKVISLETTVPIIEN